VRHVQKGVYYSPRVQFYAFDIKVLPDPGFLAWDEATKLFNECEFMCTEALGRGMLLPSRIHRPKNSPLPLPQSIFSLSHSLVGKLSDLLKFNVESFESTIPGRLKLPPIAKNFAEGVVLKPVTPLYTAKGNRAILKKKHSSFTEYTATQVALSVAKRAKKEEGQATPPPAYSNQVHKVPDLDAKPCQ